ncbi:hypothetical protein [Lysinibacillus pakistanensis]|uniref:DUF4760 domain-containing protein n=1 Tax=Lysinibacillus pakistanensis TaxID=759811 RepID=A0AAX3X5G0_9BACI|nr:hypothetical protein [Lysinibacillus pakistanensis]MDM5233494.1 hypothetical protein [Lysinibacillus pakistanensis]WHY48966.1 hypothetical protein QNH22_12305 [Lysinibacillus pakistanensis]WHY53977.1 hypothetical protein QNH24_12285 [Lysinibacillus pakistanensis]
MSDIIAVIGGLSSFVSLILAGVIAWIGVSQSKKKDTDRFYEYLEIMINLKMELEIALASYVSQDDLEAFNNLNTRYTAFVNYLDYFSAKIINQNLFNNKAFKQFQGETHQGLKEWAIIQLRIYGIIEELKFNKFGITSSSTTRKSNLRNTYKLLKLTLPSKDYEEIQDSCRKYGLF